jgi:Ca2+-binding EF-hand superfamily protein
MTSVSSLGAYQYSAKNYSSLDRNGDGIVSADEIQASAKSGNGISSLGSDQEDSGAAGGAATNQLLTMLVNMIMNLSSGQSSGSSDSSGGNSPGRADRLAELDTDGDGSLSASEFLAGRPEDVSEDMATNLFTQLDTDGDGVVSSDELSAMTPPKGPPPPDISAGRTGEDDQSTESATAIEDLLSRLEEIAKAYMAFNADEAATQSITA